MSLDRVIALHDTQKEAEAKLEAAQQEFRAAVQAALAAGDATVKQISEATGLTKWRIYQIRDGRY